MSSSTENKPGRAGEGLLLTSSVPPGTHDAAPAPIPLTAVAEAAPPSVRAVKAETDTRVLVVEDERIVGLHLRQQLVKMGYKVISVVSSGEEALKIAAERRPDVVLMDIHIEGDIDGIETARQMPRDYILPVIYLTAYSGESTLERARATKPYGYLLKPFGERELHATVQMAMERSRSDQDARDREDRLVLALGLASSNRVWC